MKRNKTRPMLFVIFMRIQHKRRGQQKTDYKKRLALLKSGSSRFVVRKSLENMRIQVIEFNPSGDKTLASAFSVELEKFGWKGGNGNIPAAYLTGLLAGVRAKKSGIGEAVLDMGLQTSTKGSRIYAALKGAVDAGLSVSHSEDVLPAEERVSGKHIQGRDMKKTFAEVKEKILKEGK